MERYYVGVDGGGTKTVLVVINQNCDEVYRTVGGTININGVATATAKQNLQDILKQIPFKQDIVSGCLGIAGISNAKTLEFLNDMKNSGDFPCEFSFVGDHVTALKGALLEQDGVLLISGTGSICVGQSKDGEYIRTGGMGHLIDDVGSGYAIGRDILSAVVQANDGRAQKTSLQADVFKALDISSIEQLVQFVYNPERSKKDIASLAKLLPANYQKRDKASEQIRDKTANDLVSLCEALVKRLGLENGLVALSGSIIQKDDGIRASFEQRLNDILPNFKTVIPKQDAAYGAAVIAFDKSKKDS